MVLRFFNNAFNSLSDIVFLRGPSRRRSKFKGVSGAAGLKRDRTKAETGEILEWICSQNVL